MDEIVKHINDTNASYRQLSAGDAKNTDLFLDNEHFELFKDSGSQITVRYNKENLSKAILFIASILPRKYDQSAIHKIVPYSREFVTDQLAILDALFVQNGVPVETITQEWNARKDVPQKNGKIDSRFYFNGLLKDVSFIDHSGVKCDTKFTIRNYFAGGFSDLHIKKADDGVFDVLITNVNTPYEDNKEDGLEYIELDSSHSPLQQIFYGAPGTGKSHTIKESLERVPKENIFRTTFHPDSDYSTFVGAYKPTMQKQIDRIYTKDELISKLTELKEGGVTYSPQKFGARYWRSLKSLSLSDKKEILQACGMSDNYTVEFDKGVAIGEENLIGSKESRIVYSFVAQAFLHAYLQAYRKSDENVYLIIEEINRGNCAQIFGDLFQLLDRNEKGSSEYAIKADADLKAYLEEELGEDNLGIKNGELCLPANMFIWATMNTSDQSLFPIDSAFKRRWEWKYIPIYNAEKDWSIEAGVNKYDWWSFLNSINRQIQDVTSSEDKKLGYFFVKADADGMISAEKFVGKVAFYLWNDVFKDYGFDGEIFQGESGEPIAFQDFFLCNGKANEDTVARFLKNLGVNPTDESCIEYDSPNAGVKENKKSLVAVTIDGERLSSDNMPQFDVYLNTIKKIGIDKAGPIVEEMKYRRIGSPMATKNPLPSVDESGKFSYVKINDYYFLKGAKSYTLIRILEDLNEQLALNMRIESK